MHACITFFILKEMGAHCRPNSLSQGEVSRQGSEERQLYIATRAQEQSYYSNADAHPKTKRNMAAL